MLTQVVRYSALVGGIGYGILHRRTLQAKFDKDVMKKEERQRDELVQEAKKAYAKLKVATAPAVHGFDGTSAHLTTAVNNPEDPDFDLERSMEIWETE